MHCRKSLPSYRPFEHIRITSSSETTINPVHVTEMANKVYHDTALYYKGTDLIDITKFTGSDMLSAGKAFKVKHWDPTSIGWLKGNMNASIISTMKGTTVGHIQLIYGKMIGDYPILTAETDNSESS